MKRSSAMLLGVLTFWPLLYMFLFIAGIALASASALPFGALFAVHGATMVLCIGLLIYYVVHVLRSPQKQSDRLLWAILLFVGGMIAMPIYWYMFIWNAEPRG